MLPASKAVPKEMLPVFDKPLIQYAVEEARAAGIERFVFVTRQGKGPVADHFDRDDALLAHLEARGETALAAEVKNAVLPPDAAVFVYQTSPRGLGHAVLCAREAVGDEPFAVLLPDELLLAEPPCLAALMDVYRATGGSVVALAEVPRAETGRYGIAAPREGARGEPAIPLADMVEKPDPAAAPSTLAIVGRYVLHPAVFDLLEAQPPGRGGEIQLTDALAALARTGPLHGLRFDGRRFDCGDGAGLLLAALALALDRPDARKRLLPFLRETIPSARRRRARS